jgi:hypothetical protein
LFSHVLTGATQYVGGVAVHGTENRLLAQGAPLSVGSTAISRTLACENHEQQDEQEVINNTTRKRRQSDQRHDEQRRSQQRRDKEHGIIA